MVYLPVLPLLRRTSVKKGHHMLKVFSLMVLLVLSGCAGAPQAGYSQDPCSESQSSYNCQVMRYMNAP